MLSKIKASMLKETISHHSTVLLTLIFTFLGCSFIFAFDLFLTWDASFQIYDSIHNQEFSVMTLRWIMYLLKAPFSLYILNSDSLNIDYAVKLFGITYSYIPFIAILILSIITKTNPRVFRYISFAILLPTVLYQYHSLAEHLIAIQIFWLFIGFNSIDTTSSHHHYKKIINGLFIFILFFTHPVSSFLLSFWGLFHLYKYFLEKKENDFKVFILYCLIGIIRFAIIYMTSPDQETVSAQRMSLVFLDIFIHSKTVLMCFFLIPVLLLSSIYMNLKKDFVASYLVFMIVFLCFIYIFFNIQEQIITILTLRYFQFLFHLPFFVFFYKLNFIDKKNDFMLTGSFTIISSILFMSIVSTMAVGRYHSIEKVIDHYQSNNIDCIESHHVKSNFNTLPFGHFATPFEIVLHQRSLSPNFIILANDQCSDLTSVEEAWINLYVSRKENIYPTINLKNIIKSSHE